MFWPEDYLNTYYIIDHLGVMTASEIVELGSRRQGRYRRLRCDLEGQHQTGMVGASKEEEQCAGVSWVATSPKDYLDWGKASKVNSGEPLGDESCRCHV